MEHLFCKIQLENKFEKRNIYIYAITCLEKFMHPSIETFLEHYIIQF